MSTSEDEFCVWFRQKVQQLHGIDMTQPIPAHPSNW